MQIAGIFLLPNGTFVVELIIVFILLFVTSRFILPPLTKVMNERDAEVRGSLEAAESARAEAAAADEERRVVIERGRIEAREILAAAHAEGDATIAAAHARAQSEYDRIVSEAETEVTAARQRAVEEAIPQLGTIVMGVVERVVGRQVDMSAHIDLVEQAASDLRSATPASGREVTT